LSTVTVTVHLAKSIGTQLIAVDAVIIQSISANLVRSWLHLCVFVIAISALIAFIRNRKKPVVVVVDARIRTREVTVQAVIVETVTTNFNFSRVYIRVSLTAVETQAIFTYPVAVSVRVYAVNFRADFVGAIAILIDSVPANFRRSRIRGWVPICTIDFFTTARSSEPIIISIRVLCALLKWTGFVRSVAILVDAIATDFRGSFVCLVIVVVTVFSQAIGAFTVAITIFVDAHTGCVACLAILVNAIAASICGARVDVLVCVVAIVALGTIVCFAVIPVRVTIDTGANKVLSRAILVKPVSTNFFVPRVFSAVKVIAVCSFGAVITDSKSAISILVDAAA